MITNQKIISVFIAFYLLFYILYFIPPVQAVESTQSATLSASLKSKLKTLQDEIASKAARLKQEISQKLQNKAYVGFVKSKSDNTLTIEDTDNTQTVVANEYTEFSGKGKISFKTLAIGDYIAALGDLDDNNALTAKKIVKLDSEEKIEKQIISGQIIEKSKNTLDIKTKEGEYITLNVGPKTIYQKKRSEASLEDLKLNTYIVAIGIKTEDELIEASFVYTLSTQAAIQTKHSTSSSTVSEEKKD